VLTTSSRASLRRADCLRSSPPLKSATPLINSSCVVLCLEWRDKTGFEALITSWYLSMEIPTFSIISSPVGFLSSWNHNSSFAFWISDLICTSWSCYSMLLPSIQNKLFKLKSTEVLVLDWIHATFSIQHSLNTATLDAELKMKNWNMAI